MRNVEVFRLRSGSARTRRPWTAHVVALTAVTLAVAGGVLAVVNRQVTIAPSGDPVGGTQTWNQIVLALAYTVAGWLLAVRRPEVVFGWLALAAAVGHGRPQASAGRCSP